MKPFRRSGNFLLCLLFNMLLSLEWTVPAWILLALHYIIGLHILWFWLALGLWLLSIIIWMGIIGWASRCGSVPDKPKENKNPYSAKNSDFILKSKTEKH